MEDHNWDSFANLEIPLISRVSETLFCEISESGGVINDRQLLKLHFLHERNLSKALQILDSKGVTCFQAQPSGRRIYQVQSKSKSDKNYLVYPDHFCGCYSFHFDVVQKQIAAFCKHQLAAKLAIVTNKFIQTHVDVHQLISLITRLEQQEE
eukprot:TRINITY_DN17456_c0_g1_i1.p1 TRINITY_DN17456_c0_g1~~TRINITY_DN17456_c0_g1_i1.p1  ORF type:complete len:152 (-),score=1.30 TRINITY_DN17456_c0_g1_i1:201-656(-)